MAHLSFQYSAGLGADLDLGDFCIHMRDVMRDSGVFPLGGIRVRGICADVCAVASGEEDLAFLDMMLRMGQGRDEATRSGITETVYTAAESWLKPRLGVRPFALSLEVLEIDTRFAEKRFNTLHAFLESREGGDG